MLTSSNGGERAVGCTTEQRQLVAQPPGDAEARRDRGGVHGDWRLRRVVLEVDGVGPRVEPVVVDAQRRAPAEARAFARDRRTRTRPPRARARSGSRGPGRPHQGSHWSRAPTAAWSAGRRATPRSAVEASAPIEARWLIPARSKSSAATASRRRRRRRSGRRGRSAPPACTGATARRVSKVSWSTPDRCHQAFPGELAERADVEQRAIERHGRLVAAIVAGHRDGVGEAARREHQRVHPGRDLATPARDRETQRFRIPLRQHQLAEPGVVAGVLRIGVEHTRHSFCVSAASWCSQPASHSTPPGTPASRRTAGREQVAVARGQALPYCRRARAAKPRRRAAGRPVERRHRHDTADRGLP